MNRFFFFILFLILSCCPSFAIDKETARKIAVNALKVERSENLVPVNTLHTKSAEDGFSPFYIFNSEKGFVIVAGYEAAHPVLAFSESGRFDYSRIPDAMKAYLEMTADVITRAKRASLKPGPAVQAEWNHYISGTRATDSEVLLETAHWAQGDPYNRMCPFDNGVRSVTGCTNTATAIIMRYHKWPEKGTGTLPDYMTYFNSEPVNNPGHHLGHKYDWDQMPTYDLSSASNPQASDYQKDQIAHLMYDVGIMNQAAYGSQATSSGLHSLGLIRYFNYDARIQKMNRADCHHDLEWESVIKNEIDSSRPVFYGFEFRSGGGHAVVIDGYKGRLFHINFGWGGDSDAFLSVTPIDGEESQVTYRYRTWQHMVVGIQPDKGIVTPGVKTVTLTLEPDKYAQIHKGFNYRRGEKYYADSQILNNSSDAISLDVAFGLVNGNGIIEEIISDTRHLTVECYDNDNWNTDYRRLCQINIELRPDHTIQLCQLKNGEWQVLPSIDEGVFHFSHSGQLRQLSELEYEKSIPNDSEWERVGFHVPSDAVLTIETEEGQILYNDCARNNFSGTEKDDLRISQFKGYIGSYYGFIVVDRKRSLAPKTIIVTLSDLVETTSFKITL